MLRNITITRNATSSGKPCPDQADVPDCRPGEGRCPQTTTPTLADVTTTASTRGGNFRVFDTTTATMLLHQCVDFACPAKYEAYAPPATVCTGSGCTMDQCCKPVLVGLTPEYPCSSGFIGGGIMYGSTFAENPADTATILVPDPYVRVPLSAGTFQILALVPEEVGTLTYRPANSYVFNLASVGRRRRTPRRQAEAVLSAAEPRPNNARFANPSARRGSPLQPSVRRAKLWPTRNLRRGAPGVASVDTSALLSVNHMPKSFIMTPEGLSVLAFAETQGVGTNAQITAIYIIQLFANRSLATGLGDFSVRSKINLVGATGTPLSGTAYPATARVSLAYTIVGGVPIAMMNGPWTEQHAIDLADFTVTNTQISPPRDPAALTAYASASKFMWIPEGLPHNGRVYNLLAVGADVLSQHIYAFLGNTAGGQVESVAVDTSSARGTGTAAPVIVDFSGAFSHKEGGFASSSQTKVFTNSDSSIVEIAWVVGSGDNPLARFKVEYMSRLDSARQIGDGSSCPCEGSYPTLGPAKIVPPTCARETLNATGSTFPIDIVNPSNVSNMTARVAVLVNGAPPRLVSVGGGAYASVADQSNWTLVITPNSTLKIKVPVAWGDNYSVKVYRENYASRTSTKLSFVPSSGAIDAANCGGELIATKAATPPVFYPPVTAKASVEAEGGCDDGGVILVVILVSFIAIVEGLVILWLCCFGIIGLAGKRRVSPRNAKSVACQTTPSCVVGGPHSCPPRPAQCRRSV